MPSSSSSSPLPPAPRRSASSRRSSGPSPRTLVRARAEVGAAQAQRRIAFSAVLPRLDAEASGTLHDREASADLGGATVTLQPREDWAARLVLAQPLYLGGRVSKAIAQADLALDAAKAAEASAAERVLLVTATDYMALVAADARIAVERQNVDLASSRRRSAASLLEAGEATNVDVLRAETAQKAAEQKLEAARQERLEAESRLRLDVVADGAIEVTTPAAPAAPLVEVPSVEELTARALVAHPDLTRSADEVGIARLEVGRQRGSRLPSVFLGAAVTRQESSFPSPNPAWVSLSVRLPIYDGGEAAARVAQARRREEEAASADAEARATVREEIRRAVAGLATARKTLELAKEQLSAAEAEHAQVEALYRALEVTSLDIDSAEASLADARRAVVTQTLASQIAGLRVLYAAGSLHSTLLK